LIFDRLLFPVGRLTERLVVEVHYLAPNAEVAFHETQAVDPGGIRKPIIPVTLFTIDEELQYVVDLTNDAALRAFNVSAAGLTGEWRLAAFAGT